MIFQPNLIANVATPIENGVIPQPNVTHHIGRFRYPLTTPQESTVFLAHYSGKNEPFSGPVKKLTFLHVGSPEFPTVFPFSTTCDSIEFTGHIASINAVYGIISQLPKLKKATIFIGPTQQHYYSEAYSAISVCPSVRKLKIVMNLDYFYSFQHFDCDSSNIFECNNGTCLSSMQYSLIHLVESLLTQAKCVFPNLKNLIVELPENETLCKLVHTLIQSCPGLQKKTRAAVQQVLSVENNQAYAVEGRYHEVSSSGQIFKNERAAAFSEYFNPNVNGALTTFSRNQPMQQAVHFQQNQSRSHYAQFSPIQESTMAYQNRNQSPPDFSALPPQPKRGGRKHKPGKNLRNTVTQPIHQQQDLYQRVNSWLSTLEM